MDDLPENTRPISEMEFDDSPQQPLPTTLRVADPIGYYGEPGSKSLYLELLKDDRWLDLRDRILTRDNHMCQECGHFLTRLIVHHKIYKYKEDGFGFVAPWDYSGADLITLCLDCHKTKHPNKQQPFKRKGW